VCPLVAVWSARVIVGGVGVGVCWWREYRSWVVWVGVWVVVLAWRLLVVCGGCWWWLVCWYSCRVGDLVFVEKRAVRSRRWFSGVVAVRVLDCSPVCCGAGRLVDVWVVRLYWIRVVPVGGGGCVFVKGWVGVACCGSNAGLSGV